MLASEIADSLNSKFKGQKVAYFLDGSASTPTDIDDFISTGSSILDLAISNRPDGGIAVGRITEINGLSSTGKSISITMWVIVSHESIEHHGSCCYCYWD